MGIDYKDIKTYGGFTLRKESYTKSARVYLVRLMNVLKREKMDGRALLYKGLQNRAITTVAPVMLHTARFPVSTDD